MSVTADSITDEQIRELRVWALAHCHKHDAPEQYAQYVKGSAAMYSADVAIGKRRARRGDSRARARARCAEILNARSEGK